MILTLVYWRSALLRALYTVLAAAVPLMAPLIGGGWDAARQALLALAFAAVLSGVTSIASLPEAGGAPEREGEDHRTPASFARLSTRPLFSAFWKPFTAVDGFQISPSTLPV